MDYFIYGGTVVSSNGSNPMNIGIRDGKICQLTDPDTFLTACHTINAAGKYILPGLIDEHIHFNDPGPVHREDFEHATAACAVGGITTAIAMPTNNPLILNKDAYDQTLKAYDGRGYVDYAIHGGLDASNAEKIDQFWLSTGITAIKTFICHSSPDMGWIWDDILFQSMKTLASCHATMIVHAENHDLISLYEERLRRSGRQDGIAHCHSHPEISELEAIQRIILFVEQTGVTTVFPHVSSWKSLSAIRDANDRGLPVYAEICPQYLTFTEQDVQEKGPYLKFTPPVHSEQNRQHLLALVKKGYGNTVGSDHSPYTREEKEQGNSCIWNAPNGIPGLEVLLPILLNAVNENHLTLEQLVSMTSATPAFLYQLPGKGKIAPGYDADLVIVDLNQSKTFSQDMIQSKCPWSPYLGMTWKGWPVLTMVRGTVVAENFQLTVQKGYGRHIARNK